MPNKDQIVRPAAQRPFLQFSLRALLALPVGFAILFAFRYVLSWPSLVAVAVMILAITFVEIRSRIVLITLIAVLLVPFAWLLVIDYPHRSYWWKWVSMWPTLPGLIPANIAFGPAKFSDVVVESIAALITLSLLATGTGLGRFNRLLFCLVIAFLGIFASVCSAIAYQMFYV